MVYMKLKLYIEYMPLIEIKKEHIVKYIVRIYYQYNMVTMLYFSYINGT